MFATILTVLFLLALLVGVLNFRKSKQEDLSPNDSPAHEVMAIEFEHLRAKGDKPIVVMFFATWCTACVAQTPGFRRVAKSLDEKAHFVFVDIDKNKSLTNRMEIRKIPVIMVFTDQESPAAKRNKVLSDDELTEFVESTIGK